MGNRLRSYIFPAPTKTIRRPGNSTVPTDVTAVSGPPLKCPLSGNSRALGITLMGLDKNQSDEQGIYKRQFTVLESWEGTSVEVVFQGVMTDAEVQINGKLAGPIHQGAFYAFSYDVSKLLRYGQENSIKITVSKKSSNASINKAERLADYWVFGGIFRPVYLQSKPKTHINRVAIDAKADGQFKAYVYRQGDDNTNTLTAQIETLEGEVVGQPFQTSVQSQFDYHILSTQLANPEQWSPEFPNLYKVTFSLKDAGDNIIHQTSERFGFRTVEVRKGDGIYVNGQKIRFKGSAYHTFWPSSGRTTSKDLIIKDINLMKDMNMNAVRATTYPHTAAFYEVCDSLGLFVISELGGWRHPYNTETGRELVRTTVTRDVNHPSIVMWANGNHFAYNPDFEPMFYQWDIQDRIVLHNAAKAESLPLPANPETPIVDTRYYPTWQQLNERLNGDYPYMSMEALHALYDGGGGASLQDYWTRMEDSPLGAGLFIWAYLDECIERSDKGGKLDCAGNAAPDGIVGPYRKKEGSYYAIKDIWSPVQIQRNTISAHWNQQLRVENRYNFTNLKQVEFSWKLISFSSPLETTEKKKILENGTVASPDIMAQNSGFLELDLPKDWVQADALQLTATDPHGRKIYQWSFPIKTDKEYARENIPQSNSSGQIQEKLNSFVLSSEDLTVHVSKEMGYVTEINSGGRTYSLSGGPAETGGAGSLKEIKQNGNQLQAIFERDSFSVNYSITNRGLKIDYSYRPEGKKPYFGIGFNYPEEKVNSIEWLGHGPDRVWKNRQAGMEYDLWNKERKTKHKTSLSGYRWDTNWFAGYYSNVNWATLKTDEGPITFSISNPDVYLGILCYRKLTML